MKSTRELVSEIIDRVETAVLESNPEIDVEEKKGNTLLHGEDYYELEDELYDFLSTHR